MRFRCGASWWLLHPFPPVSGDIRARPTLVCVDEADCVNTTSLSVPCRVAVLLALTLANSSPVPAAEPPEASIASGTTRFRDVRLGAAGTLQLQVLTASGQAVAGQIVSIVHSGREIARSQTSAKGRVLVKGLRPGLHLIRVGREQLNSRLWTAQTAPPTSLENPAFVMSGQTVRGQYGPVAGPLMPNLAPAALATGVTAAAVAAVIVGKNSSDERAFVPASP